MINDSNIEQRVSVCFATDDNYVQHLSVAIVSMLINSKSGRGIDIYILTDGLLSEQSERRLRSLCRYREDVAMYIPSIDQSLFSKCRVEGRITLPTYYRLFATKLLPEVDRMVYLDCDIAVVGDVTELYDTDLEGKSVGAVRDANGSNHKVRYGFVQEDFTYCNAGVLLMDLGRIREIGLDAKFEWSVENEWERAGDLMDQSILNIVMEREREFFYMGHEWNLYYNSTEFDQDAYAKALASPKIIHFLGGIKPWQRGCVQERQEIYWSYLRHTPYRKEWFMGQSRRFGEWLRYMLWDSTKSADRRVKRIKVLRLTLFKRREVDGRRLFYIFGVRIW